MKYWAVIKDRETKELFVLQGVECTSKKVLKKEISSRGYDLVDGFIYNEEQWKESQKENSEVLNLIEARKAKRRAKNKERRAKKRAGKLIDNALRPKSTINDIEQFKSTKNVPKRFRQAK